MKEEQKNELRKKIEELLNRVPDGTHIHIDKDLLEVLIFEELSEKQLLKNLEDKEDKKTIKKEIVWSGDFLSKIDLSEVSFENVDWATPTYKIFRNTNAKPNFKLSCNVKQKGFLSITGADFSGTNLSFFAFDFRTNFVDCNFQYTDINIVNWKYIKATKTFFDHNDFFLKMMECRDYLNQMSRTSFQDTGMHFIERKALGKEYSKKMKKIIEEGYLKGCYMDGKLIQPGNSAIEEIEEQIASLKNQLIQR